MRDTNNKVMMAIDRVVKNKANGVDERWVSHHVSNSSYYKHRVINLFGDFTPDTVSIIVEQLLIWEEEDAELLYQNSLKRDPVQEEQILDPILININSYGGNMDELAALVDVIEGMDAPIITRAIGKAYSCAFVLFCLGDERLIGPNCSLMYHTVSGGMIGKLADVSNYTEYLKDCQTKMKKLVMDKTNITKKTIEAWDRAKVDRWISVEDALKYGIATDTTY